MNLAKTSMQYPLSAEPTTVVSIAKLPLMQAEEKTLDIIIPSYRFDVNVDCITTIASLCYPADWAISFFLIGDNPEVHMPAKIQDLIESGEIIFTTNKKNEGLNFSRNKGIDISKGSWLLFLDDDIIPKPNLLFSYINAIETNPGASGFAGVVNFPEPTNSFTKALQAAGYTYFFSLAKHQASLPWATGANMLFNRSKIDQLRFSTKFNNSEGGDEVEFAIQLKEKQYSDMVAVPDAEVLHPWWHDGKINYGRAFKYSRGNYRLLKLHPRFTIYRFCNLTELVLLLFVLSPVAVMGGISWRKWLSFITAIILVDALLHTIKCINERKAINPGVILHTWILKLAEQAGYTSVCIENCFVPGIIKKFDIELRDKKGHFHTNRWLFVKVFLFAISGVIIFIS